MLSMRCFTSGVDVTALTSLFSRCTTSAGVPAGATMPYQADAYILGTPASSNVGISGAAEARWSLGTAKARIVPAFTCGSSAGMLSIMKSIWPATRSVTAGPVPV
ncbi:hypothetical protein G6F59_018266 [Rhizopus arrhizus]|nr:hypothetical protein G6F59_018266 [Rhizopus arrhizus]